MKLKEKKGIAFLLIICLTLSAFAGTGSISQAADGANLISNSSFENKKTFSNSLQDWNIYDEGTTSGHDYIGFSRQSGGYEGSYCLKLSRSLKTNGQTPVGVIASEKSFSMTPGKTYEISYQYKADEGNGAAVGVVLIVRNSTTGNQTWEYFTDYNCSGVSSQWEKVVFHFTAQEGWNTANLNFQVLNGAGTLYLDDVQVKEISVAAQTTNMGFEQGSGTTVPGFEISTMGSYEVTTGASYEGTKSLYIKHDSPAGNTVVSGEDTFQLTGGKEYTLDAYVKSRNTNMSEMYLAAEVISRGSVFTLGKDTDTEVYGRWYHQTSVGTPFNDTHYVEIVENGADDLGALHFVQSSGTHESDMQIAIRNTVPAGNYTVSMKVKGNVALASETFHLYFGNQSVDVTPTGNYAEWTEITQDVTVSSDLYYLQLIFSQYNYGTDFYIDNIKVTNKDTGSDVLEGVGNFVSSDIRIEELGGSGDGKIANVSLNRDSSYSGWKKISIPMDLTSYNGSVEVRPSAIITAGKTELYLDGFTCEEKAAVTMTPTDVTGTDEQIAEVREYLAQDTSTTKAEVKLLKNGKPALYINGAVTPAMMYLRGDRTEQYKGDYGTGMYQAGVGITAVQILLDSASVGTIWTGEGSYNFDIMDKLIYQTLIGQPDAKLLLQIDTTPPQWWLDAHPNSVAKMSNGTTVGVTYASEEWQSAIDQVITAMCQHWLDSDYAKRIVGVRMVAGNHHEWQYWGVTQDVCADFSSAAVAGFRAWLTDKYGTDSALQTAWSDKTATINNASVPTLEERQMNTSLLDPGSKQKVLDFQMFMCNSGADAVIRFANTIKSQNSDWIVGTYNGYMTMGYSYEANGTAHMAIERVLACEDIDFIAAPYGYGERQSGMSAAYQVMVDSILQSGKLFLMECDNRTLFADQDESASNLSAYGKTYTMEETLNQLKRDIANVITKGAGLWWYDMQGGWFNDEQIYELIRYSYAEMQYANANAGETNFGHPTIGEWTTDIIDSNSIDGKVKAVSDGCNDVGSVHFDKPQADGGSDLRIGVMGKSWEANQTYIFEAMVKGTATGDNPQLWFSDGNGVWSATQTQYQSFEVNSQDWEKISFEFEIKNGEWRALYVQAGGYCTADFHIDNICVYKKGDETKTSVLSNGNFYTPAPEATNDIAWIVDDDIYSSVSYNFNASHQLLNQVMFQQKQELANLGSGYDMYYLSSLENNQVPEYSVYILTGFDFSDAERTVIKEKLQKDGNVVIFSSLSGVIKGNSLSANNISDITGISVTSGNGLSFGGRLTAGSESGNYFGDCSAYSVSPLVYINDNAATTLGTFYSDSSKVALAKKTMDDWTSIYSAAGAVPVSVLRDCIGENNLYSQNASDVVFSGCGYVAVDSPFGGERTLNLGGTYNVYDVYAGDYVARTTSVLNVTLEAGETRLYRLEKPENWLDLTFEEMTSQDLGDWSIADNQDDTLNVVRSDEGENVLVHTKGASAAESAALATPQIAVEGGVNYSVKFTAHGTGSYFVRYYGWDADENLTDNFVTVIDGTLGTDEKVVSGYITPGTNTSKIQIRIIYRSSAGDSMYVSGYSLSKLNEPTAFSGWSRTHTDYSDPNKVGVSDLEFVDNEGRDGSNAIRLIQTYDASLSTVGFGQTVSGLTAGKKYNLSFWVKGNYNLNLDLKDGLGTWTKSNSRYQDVTYGECTDWTQFTYEFTASATSGGVALAKNQWAASNFLIDDISIYAVEDSTQTNLLTNGELNFTVEEELEEFLYWDYENFFSDPDIAGKSDVEFVKDGGHDGSAIHIVQDYSLIGGQGYQPEIAQAVQLTQGVNYTLSFWIKGRLNNSTNLGLNTTCFDLAWSLGTWDAIDESRGTVSGEYLNAKGSYDDWTQVQYTFTASTSDQKAISISVGQYGDADFYIDDIQIYATEDESRTNLLYNSEMNFKTKESNLLKEAYSRLKPFELVADVTTSGTSSASSSKFAGQGSILMEENATLTSTEKASIGSGDTITVAGYYSGNEVPEIAATGITPSGEAKDFVVDWTGAKIYSVGGGWYYFKVQVKTMDVMSCAVRVTANKSTRIDNLSAGIDEYFFEGDADANEELDARDLVRLMKYQAAPEKTACAIWSCAFTNGTSIVAGDEKTLRIVLAKE